MKTLLAALFCSFLSFSALAQEYDEYGNPIEESAPAEPAPLSCYEKYVKLFEERGCEPVPDGLHEDVVIVVDNGSAVECYSGRANVVNGRIAPSSIKVASDSGDPQPVAKVKGDSPVGIKDGFMHKIITANNESVVVIFPKYLKPKKSAYKKAPEPKMD